MSGGSFNYLYRQEPYDVRDLGSMVYALHHNGFPDAAEATLRIKPDSPMSYELSKLWQAMEWFYSSDWGFAEVEEAYRDWRKEVDG